MTEFTLHSEQVLNAPLERVFAFFSDAGNLEAITPPILRFRITSPRPITMHVGAVIDYRLKLHGIPFRWRSVISAWEPMSRFVDEQVKGPYRLWVHEHRFDAIDEQRTRVTDHVRYAVPGGVFMNRWFVRPRLDGIFAFRAKATKSLVEVSPTPVSMVEHIG